MTLRSSERARGFVHVRTPTIANFDLSDLADVTITSATDGQYLRYNGTTWVNENPEDRFYTEAEVDTLLSGKSNTGHTHVEADITDLDKYTQAQVNTLLAAQDALSELTDVVITTPSVGQVMYYNGASWVNTGAIQLDPVGTVDLYYNGGQVMETTDTGIRIFDTDTVTPTPALWLHDGTADGGLLFYNAAANRTEFQARQDSDTVIVRGRNSVSAFTTMAEFDPDGPCTLYYTGVQAFTTGPSGIQIYDTSGSIPAFELFTDAAAQVASFFYNTALFIRALGHGDPVTIQGEDAGGVVRTMINADPDGAVSLYNAGTEVATTTGTGLSLDTAGNNSDILFTDIDNQTAFIQKNSTGPLVIRNQENSQEVRIDAHDSGGAARLSLRCGTSGTNPAMGFQGTAPIAKPTVTGSRGGNAALASLLTALANYGLITDSTTA